MPARREATVEDLYRFDGDGKPELVNGELVVTPHTCFSHGRAVMKIAAALYEYEHRTRAGWAFGDSVGFIVQLPNRRSFAPDAAFHVGPPFGERIIEGSPVFAVEVRSPEDYGPAAERAMAAKRADYFAAGTLVVWDVDVIREGWIAIHRAADPEHPTICRRGSVADAEPGLPGWRFPVDDLFTFA